MSAEFRTFGQMVPLVFEFTELHYPFISIDGIPSSPVSLSPERIFTDNNDIQSFLDSLRPSPSGCQELLKQFIAFQLAKPMRTFAWLAHTICDLEPRLISDSPDVTFSYIRDSQEIERFMRSLHCENHQDGNIQSLEAECEPDSTQWREVKNLLAFILERDSLQYKSESEDA